MSAICCRNIATFDAADVSVKMGAELGDTYYAHYFYGISGDASEGLNEVELINGSRVRIDIDSKGAYDSSGIASTGNEACTFVTLEDGSELDINVKTSGDVVGIDVRQPVSVTDSTLKINAASYDTAIVMGVICPKMNVELTDSKYAVDITAENGVALFATDLDTVDSPEYEEGYEPLLIKISKDAKILAPENGEVNRYGFDPMRMIIPGETVYSADNKEEAAARVLIAVPKPPAPPTGDSMLFWTAIMAAAVGLAALMLRRKEKDVKRSE